MKDAILGVKENVNEGIAYLTGMEEYAFAFPLVMMDITKDVITTTSKSSEYQAPINQFGRIRTFVDLDFKGVVRISVNSLWSLSFLDLEAEPMIVSIPDTNGRYIVMQALNMWTDDFASVGTRTTGSKAGNYLIAGPKWDAAPPEDVDDTFRCSTPWEA